MKELIIEYRIVKNRRDSYCSVKRSKLSVPYPDLIWYRLNGMGVKINPTNSEQDVASVFTEVRLYARTHPVFTCSKLTIETLEQGVKYVKN